MSQSFGGNWTDRKLETVEKYLQPYTTIMSKQNFRFAYIDAFAGTGYNTIRDEDDPQTTLFSDLTEDEPTRFRDTSVQIALKIQPPFQTYFFIEKDEKRFAALQNLKTTFPQLDIRPQNQDANTFLKEICAKKWNKNRAVLFLDPFGMQVSWDTIEAIAATQAIDMWYLFPLGVGVSRLLKRDGDIKLQWREKLNSIFGDTAWYDAFYHTEQEPKLPMFPDEPSKTRIVKTANFDAITAYILKRLNTVFAGVARNPLKLTNSKNNPLYLLCFAASNPKGAPIAVRIAEQVLRQ